MTIDRCIFICSINKSDWRSPRYVFVCSCLIWLASFIFSIPKLMSYNTETQFTIETKLNSPNSSKWSSSSSSSSQLDNLTMFYSTDYISSFSTDSPQYQSQSKSASNLINVIVKQICVHIMKDQFWINFINWYLIIISYILPASVLIICYIKILLFMRRKREGMFKVQNAKALNHRVSIYRQRRVTKTVIILTSNFVILWFPVHFLSAWQYWDSNFPRSLSMFIIKLIAHTMSYLIPAFNPIIYAFSNQSFRRSVSNLTKCIRIFQNSDDNFNNNNDNNNNRSHSVIALRQKLRIENNLNDDTLKQTRNDISMNQQGAEGEGDGEEKNSLLQSESKRDSLFVVYSV
jgi:hypothetical protein